MTPTTPTAADVSAEELKLKTLIERYWNLAHAEGAEGRTHDTPDGAAMKTYQAINEAIDELKAALLASAAGGGEPVDWEPLEENPRERQMFDQQAEHWGVQTAIATCLSIWASMSPGGSYAAQCNIMANEVAKLYAVPLPPVGEPQGVSDNEVADVVDRLRNASKIAKSFVLGDTLDKAADMLESFAASRPVAVGVSAGRWIPFAEKMPPEDAALDNPHVTVVRRVLVTNNLSSRDRMGRMSHVWLAMPFESTDGSVVAYTEADTKIHGLTHWLDPMPVIASTTKAGGAS